MPPLKLSWSYPKGIPDPLIAEGALFVKTTQPYGLARLDPSGVELWRRQDGVYNAGLALGEKYVLGVVDGEVGEGPKERSFCAIDPSTGTTLQEEGTQFGIGSLLPDGRSFVGVTRASDNGDFRSMTLARISPDPGLPILWQIETTDRLDKLGDADVWDSGIAYAGGCLYVGRGPYLACLDAETGKERWRGSVMAIGTPSSAGGREPAVVGPVVLVNSPGGPGGTMAFNKDTGEPIWTNPVFGSRATFRGRLYFVRPALNGGTYCVIDAVTGETVLDHPLVRGMADKYGAKSSGKWRGGTLFTRPAVSETHVFFGDDYGRLWAIERETGEPVWYHKPKGNTGYLGATPIISGNHLYITSFSLDEKRPQALYCYEQV